MRDKLLLSCILYAPAAMLYVKAVLFGLIVLGAVAGVVSLATGAIEI
jgi:arginine:ornithine antiporter/lysine permease